MKQMDKAMQPIVQVYETRSFIVISLCSGRVEPLLVPATLANRGVSFCQHAATVTDGGNSRAAQVRVE